MPYPPAASAGPPIRRGTRRPVRRTRSLASAQAPRSQRMLQTCLVGAHTGPRGLWGYGLGTRCRTGTPARADGARCRHHDLAKVWGAWPGGRNNGFWGPTCAASSLRACERGFGGVAPASKGGWTPPPPRRHRLWPGHELHARCAHKSSDLGESERPPCPASRQC